MYIFQPQFIARRGKTGILRRFVWGPLYSRTGFPDRCWHRAIIFEGAEFQHFSW